MTRRSLLDALRALTDRDDSNIAVAVHVDRDGTTTVASGTQTVADTDHDEEDDR